MQKINKEKVLLERSLADYRGLSGQVEDAIVLLEMAAEAQDESAFIDVLNEQKQIEQKFDELELTSLLNGEQDAAVTYLSIHAGAGGTEAADWAEMLYRMYTRWAAANNYKCEILDISEGDGAGIKSATLLIEGPYAYGYLKAESGVIASCGFHLSIRTRAGTQVSLQFSHGLKSTMI